MDRKNLKRIKEHTDIRTCTVHKHEKIKNGSDRHSSVCTRSQTRAKNKNNTTADLINSPCLLEENQKMIICTSSKDVQVLWKSQDSGENHVDSGYYSDNSFQKSITTGHRVGLGSFDLITKLAGVEPNLVLNIIKQVGKNIQDLVSFCKVSPQWQTIIKRISPQSASDVVRHHKKQQQIGLAHKENYSKEKIGKRLRCVTESNFPLASVQEIGKPCCTSTPKQTKDLAALHNKYYQAGQKLLVDESLTRCARIGCASPAKHLFNKQKGRCTNSNCSYEFCTNCRCDFHGGEPCKVFEKKFRNKQKGGIGSERSKTNLNRLGKIK